MNIRKSLPNVFSAKYLVVIYELAACRSIYVLGKPQLCVRHMQKQYKVFTHTYITARNICTRMVAGVPYVTKTECNIFSRNSRMNRMIARI